MSLPVVESSSLREAESFATPRAHSATRRLVPLFVVIVTLAYGCRTTAPVPPKAPEVLHGVASWYGEEFAGRTTANGEIFDPALLTAAHRTLPFGTVLDITNPKTQQTVRVRVNDRGPFIGGRVIDLSYAAAQKIGLIEPGIGEVNIRLVRVGSGEREPPVPFEATVAETPKVVPIVPAPPATDAPKVDVVPQEVVVDRIEVQTERGGVITRTQVAADGRTLEEVPATGEAAPSAARFDERRRPTRAPRIHKGQYVVQVGAFSVEANAKSLQERLTVIGQAAWIDRNDLYRVRLGPFATRDQAAAARASLEANGISAIILAE
jgi:peptidoglycan lytic transglycosylase